jgi:hypothetical protein
MRCNAYLRLDASLDSSLAARMAHLQFNGGSLVAWTARMQLDGGSLAARTAARFWLGRIAWRLACGSIGLLTISCVDPCGSWVTNT